MKRSSNNHEHAEDCHERADGDGEPRSTTTTPASCHHHPQDHKKTRYSLQESHSSEGLRHQLNYARKLRTEATSEKELEHVQSILRDILNRANTTRNCNTDNNDDDNNEDDDVWMSTGSVLATLLLQQRDDCDTTTPTSTTNSSLSEASHLLKERGFLYRLSRAALQQQQHIISLPIHSAVNVTPPSPHLAHAFDCMLPSSMYTALCQVFHPSSLYWSSHNYSDGSSSSNTPPSPYFSYVVPLNQNKNDAVLQSTLRFIQSHVAKSIPAVAECSTVEFWAHCRPHSSGHQLHFDSDDEGRGRLRHPVASTVMYLGECSEISTSSSDDHRAVVGGATLVTTQTSKSKSLAARGWLCPAKPNRLLAFAGNRLHGVLPGVGVAPTIPKKEESSSTTRRVTFMVAFWKHIRIQNDEGQGAARPFSRVQSKAWAAPLMRDVRICDGNCCSSSSSSSTGERKVAEKEVPVHTPIATTDCFIPVPVWEDVDREVNEERGESLEQLRQQRLLPSYDLFFQFQT